jgi:hypothetical protein
MQLDHRAVAEQRQRQCRGLGLQTLDEPRDRHLGGRLRVPITLA